MSAILCLEVGDMRGKMTLKGKGHSPFTVSIDYPPPLGEDQGFSSLELMMVSLASCSCHTVFGELGKSRLENEDYRDGASKDGRPPHAAHQD
jgi:uncharacterized OsmC-like protein